MSAVIPGQGYFSYLQIGIEASLSGGVVPATQKVFVKNGRYGLNRRSIESESLDGTLDLNYVAPGPLLYRFSFDVEWLYTGCEVLGHYILGSTSATSGTNPYVHTALTGGGAKSATLEFGDGISGSGKVAQATGCIVKSAKWSVKAGGILGCSISGLALVVTPDQSATGTLTFPTFDPVRAGHCTGLVDGSGDTVVAGGTGTARFKGCDIGFELGLDDKRDYMSSDSVDQPLPNSKRRTQFEIEHEWITKAAFLAHQGTTNIAAALTFTNGTKIFKLESPNGVCDDHEEGPGDFGPILAKSTIKTWGNGTFQLKASTTNANSGNPY
jgi:hypothetical protein